MKTKIQMLIEDIKEHHCSAINYTTPRTVSYQASYLDYSPDWYNLKPSSDEELSQLQEYANDNFHRILEEMIFNDNNVTGNKVTIKFDNTSYNEFKKVITRNK